MRLLRATSAVRGRVLAGEPCHLGAFRFDENLGISNQPQRGW